MLTEYVCAVKNGHRQSCGAPQTPTPQCCGKPMVLLESTPQPAAIVQPAAAAPATAQESPACKPPASQRPRKEAFRK